MARRDEGPSATMQSGAGNRSNLLSSRLVTAVVRVPPMSRICMAGRHDPFWEDGRAKAPWWLIQRPSPWN